MGKLKDYLAKRKRQKMIKLLKSVKPEMIEDFGIKGLIPAFRRAATKVPAYKKILKEHNVDYRQVIDAQSYKRLVPVLNKHKVFTPFEIEDLCVGGTIKDMKLAMSSSGFSGVFSYGINTNQNYKNISQSIDTALDYVFDFSHKETFLVNCIPMGVKVHTCLKLCENSVRSDMTLALMKKFCHKFEQTVVVSDPYFLKKLAEEGNEQKFDWKKLKVSFIFGEDWFSESFRSYMAHLIDLDIDDFNSDRIIGATMGIAELDLNLFHESKYTIHIRRAVQNNPELRKALFGNVRSTPEIYHYYPHRIFLETLPEKSEYKELVFSMLSPHMLIPLLRYNSMDRGWKFTYKEFVEILKKFGLERLTPDLHLPIVAVGGRKDRFMNFGGQEVYPEDIKQGLYEDFEAAFMTTGYFKMNQEKQILEVQLKKGVTLTAQVQSKFEKALLKYAGVDIPVKVYHYQDFPYAMELDYERKFHPI